MAKNPALPVFLISTLPEATSSKNNITISSASVCLPFLKETLLNALGLFVFKCCSICSANPSNALGSLEIAFINTECPTSCVLVSNLSSAAWLSTICIGINTVSPLTSLSVVGMLAPCDPFLTFFIALFLLASVMLVSPSIYSIASSSVCTLTTSVKPALEFALWSALILSTLYKNLALSFIWMAVGSFLPSLNNSLFAFLFNSVTLSALPSIPLKAVHSSPNAFLSLKASIWRPVASNLACTAFNWSFLCFFVKVLLFSISWASSFNPSCCCSKSKYILVTSELSPCTSVSSSFISATFWSYSWAIIFSLFFLYLFRSLIAFSLPSTPYSFSPAILLSISWFVRCNFFILLTRFLTSAFEAWSLYLFK